MLPTIFPPLRRLPTIFPPLRRLPTIFPPLRKLPTIVPPFRRLPTIFPPLAKGGLGGVVPARPVTGASHVLFFSRFGTLSRGVKRRVRPPRLPPHPPPHPPFARGGKGSLARFCVALFASRPEGASTFQPRASPWGRD